jgi:hypothetical protein
VLITCGKLPFWSNPQAKVKANVVQQAAAVTTVRQLLLARMRFHDQPEKRLIMMKPYTQTEALQELHAMQAEGIASRLQSTYGTSMWGLSAKAKQELRPPELAASGSLCPIEG